MGLTHKMDGDVLLLALVVQITDFGLTLGLQDETVIVLAVKVRQSYCFGS